MRSSIVMQCTKKTWPLSNGSCFALLQSSHTITLDNMVWLIISFTKYAYTFPIHSTAWLLKLVTWIAAYTVSSHRWGPEIYCSAVSWPASHGFDPAEGPKGLSLLFRYEFVSPLNKSGHQSTWDHYVTLKDIGLIVWMNIEHETMQNPQHLSSMVITTST